MKTIQKNLTRVLIALLLVISMHIKLKAESPNIIFILADDWGWTDWERNGHEYGSTFYETPHLNQLAQEGMMFEQAYAHPLCSPSRAALMSGKYPGARFQMHQAITGSSVSDPTLPASCGVNSKTCFPESRNNLPLNEITIAEELKAAGYKTFQFGKWHLGNANYYPAKQGFNAQFAVGGAGPGSGGYFAPYDGLDDIPQGPNGEYICERLSDEVCSKLEQVKDEKFFIYLAHFNVHSPYQSKAELEAYYKTKAAADPNNPQHHPHMGAMIASLDSSIGQINAKLNELGLAENTILIVMGDNGGIHWNNDKDPNYLTVPITSNAPLRAGKSCFYEGGVRVPLIIKYPALIDSNVVENTPVHLVDFYPTLLELAGTTVSAQKDVVDGVSILPLLSNSGKLEERPIFCHFPRAKQIGADVGGSYVRMGDYKLCRLYGLNADATDAFELYNIPLDPGEKYDSSALYPVLVDSLKTMLQVWLDETGALVPHPNPNWSGSGGSSTVDPNAPSNLVSIASESNSIELSWTNNADSETGIVLERSGDGGTLWEAIDTLSPNTEEYTDEDIVHMQFYQYRAFADFTDSTSDYSNETAGRVNIDGDQVPEPWSSIQFGQLASESEAIFEAGVFTVDAADLDFWNAADKGHFIYQPMSGQNIIMTTKVTQFDFPHSYAQAGIMLRNNLDANSNQVSMMLIGEQGCGMRERLAIDGATNQNPLRRAHETAPYWLRLKRDGNQFTGYYSSDGVHWNTERTVTSTMGDDIYVGFATTSHSSTQNCIAKYANTYFGESTGFGTETNPPLKFQVVPNPNNGHFSIHLQLTKPIDIQVTVLDLTGKSIYQSSVQNYSSGHHAVPFENQLDRGVYLIKVNNAKADYIEVQKLIVR